MKFVLRLYDFSNSVLYDSDNRKPMLKTSFVHGGATYDVKYPDGVYTSMDITMKGNNKISSGLVMYSSGHMRNETANLRTVLQFKNCMMGDIVFADRLPGQNYFVERYEVEVRFKKFQGIVYSIM